jgi:hypothetical protein
LALVDDLVQYALALGHVGVPDPVGVLGVELVDLRRAAFWSVSRNSK